ncbi:MAG: folate-binding protein, partial [Solirubrobacterales bacterium]|nr:folate-binding protein [Solirubrobacterales bacterium]
MEATTHTNPLDAGYEELRHGCALLDRSARGRLALTGAAAVEFLNGQVTNELGDLRDGEGRCAAFLTHKGKMLGDLRILAVGESPGSPPRELLLDTERVALQALFDMIRRYKLGYEVELHKRTLECAQLSLIGPRAPTVLQDAAGAPLQLPAQEHSHVPSAVAGRAARLIVTAHPAGLDLLCASSDRDAIERALLDAGAVAVSEECAEIARVEAGRPRYGVDLDHTVIPQEAGLNERAVSFTKGCYVGQETVARLHYRGKPNRHLRGLRLSTPQPAGGELALEGRVVGRLTSAVVSPGLGPIGLALVRREAEPGAVVS